MWNINMTPHNENQFYFFHARKQYFMYVIVYVGVSVLSKGLFVLLKKGLSVLSKRLL